MSQKGCDETCQGRAGVFWSLSTRTALYYTIKKECDQNPANTGICAMKQSLETNDLPGLARELTGAPPNPKGF